MTETSGGKVGFLNIFKHVFSRNNLSQTQIEQTKKEVTSIPPESGYARWIRGLEEEIKGLEEKQEDSVDQTLTVNELTQLYPHFVKTLKNPKLKVDEGGREELFKLLNEGNLQTVIKLAGFVRRDYSNGQDIVVLKKKSNKNLEPLELEAILADQFINRSQRQKVEQEQKLLHQSVPEGVISSTEGITLDPDKPPQDAT